MPVDPQSLGLARTRTSAAAAGAGTELRSSAKEWSSTAFRRLCKTPNFFRTYSFGYMHHHSAIFIYGLLGLHLVSSPLLA